MSTVHIASEVKDNLQWCLRCGVTLINYRGVALMSTSGRGPSFWAPGALVGVDGNQSYVIEGREFSNDEYTCVMDGIARAWRFLEERQ